MRHFVSYLRLSHVWSTFHWKGKNIFVFCPLNCYRYETDSLSEVSVRFLETGLLTRLINVFKYTIKITFVLWWDTTQEDLELSGYSWLLRYLPTNTASYKATNIRWFILIACVSTCETRWKRVDLFFVWPLMWCVCSKIFQNNKKK